MTNRRSKPTRGRLPAVAALGVVAAMVLAGCLGDDDSEGSDEGPLRVATPTEITSLDPLTEGWLANEYGYGELLLRPTVTGEPEPWILKSVENISPTEWELEVQDGVTFQNGGPVDGKAVAAMINHQLAENTLVQPVLPDAVAKSTGARTLTLTTKAPVSTLPEILTHEDYFPVYDVKAYESAGGDKQALIGAGLYTGPYEVTELTAQNMVLERNENYWQGTPALPGMEIRFIADHQARVLAVESGEADIAQWVPTQAATTVGNSDFVASEMGTNGPRVIFNLSQAPIDDVLVRKAIVAAVDYEAIANEVMEGGHYDVAQGMFPMHLPFAIANQVHDPDEARALLDQAGWVDSGDGGPRTKDNRPLELTLVTRTTFGDLEPIAVALRSQLEEVGIDLRIREIDSSAPLYEEDFDDEWQLALNASGFFGIQGDAVSVVDDYLTTDGGYNFGGISEPKIDAISAELYETFDEDRRNELLGDVQEIVIADKAYTFAVAEERRSAVVSQDWADFKPDENYIDFDSQTAP